MIELDLDGIKYNYYSLNSYLSNFNAKIAAVPFYSEYSNDVCPLGGLMLATSEYQSLFQDKGYKHLILECDFKKNIGEEFFEAFWMGFDGSNSRKADRDGYKCGREWRKVHDGI